MTNPKKHILQPSPHLYKALERSGHDWKTAIEDLLDNSLDAIQKRFELLNFEPRFAGSIKIDYSGKKSNRDKEYLIISDNGAGMSLEGLKNCFSPGVTTKSDARTALGAFGMGLKTASTTLGTCVKIITRNEGVGPIRSLEIDIEEMVRNNTFCCNFYETAPDSDIRLFKNHVGDSETGTVVRISGLEKSHGKLPKAQSSFSQTLTPRIGITYFDILSRTGNLKDKWPEIKIDVKGRTAAVTPQDILYSDTEFCHFLIGSVDEYEKVTCNETGQSVGIRLVKVDKAGAKKQKVGNDVEPLKGITKLGKILRRSGRTLYVGTAHDLFKGHAGSRLSNIVLDINFEDSGYNQPPIEMNVNKNDIKIKETMQRVLRDKITPFMREMEKQAEKNHKSKMSKNMGQKLKAISSQPVVVPNLLNFSNQEDSNGTSGMSEKVSANKVRSNSIKVSTNSKKSKNRYEKYSTTVQVDGQSAAIVEYMELSWPGSPRPFDVEYQPAQNKIIIQINQDHSFYSYLNSNENNDVTIPVMTSICFQFLAPESESDKHRFIENWAQTFEALHGQVKEYEPSSDEEIIVIEEVV